MSLTKQEVESVARLARLKITEGEIGRVVEKLGLLDNPGDQIQTSLNLGGIDLIALALIPLGYLVGTQALTHIQRVRHGHHIIRIRSLQLVHKIDN